MHGFSEAWQTSSEIFNTCAKEKGSKIACQTCFQIINGGGKYFDWGSKDNLGAPTVMCPLSCCEALLQISKSNLTFFPKAAAPAEV